jgi:porin
LSLHVEGDHIIDLCLRATCHAAELAENTAFGAAPATPTPDFQSLRIKGLTIALPGPQDTIDPDFAGIRSGLAALGIGYIGYSNNNFFDNVLPAERTTFGQQVYSGQKPTFFTNNVMQLTYDLSRYGISDGQIVVGGIYNFDTWEPGGPNASSLATLSYYQTFLNKQVELKVGYLANVVEYWGPFLAGNLSSGIFGPSGAIPVEAGLSAWAWTKPAVNIKVNGPNGLYNKFGVQVASSPDGPFAEKTANPTGLGWSTPNSGVLAIDEVGYRKEAAPGQLATWVRAASIVNTSKYVDFEFGGRNTGNYAAYVLADRQFVQPAPVAGQAARDGTLASPQCIRRRNSIASASIMRRAFTGLAFCHPGRGTWCPWSFREMSSATIWWTLPCSAANSRIPAIFR